MFQYAVETKQYASAYRCLSSTSRERFSLSRFKGVLWLNAEPPDAGWGGVGIRDFVVGGEFLLALDEPGLFGPATFGVGVVFVRADQDESAEPDGDGASEIWQTVTLVLEAGEWFVDLTRLKGFTA